MNRSVFRFWNGLTKVVLPLLLLSATGLSVFAEGNEDTSIPIDTCVLELNLPDNATVVVDGDDCGTRRRLKWTGLTPGTVYRVQLTVVFSGKKNTERILVEGGRKILLALSRPLSEMPKIVPQIRGMSPEDAQISSDGRLLVAGGLDGKVIVEEIATGRVLCVMNAGNHIKDVSISKKARRIAVASYKGVCVWRLSSPEKPMFLKKDGGRVVALSPDGKRLAIVGSGSGRNNGVWDVDAGERISSIPEFSGIVSTVVFSPDNRHVLATLHCIDERRLLRSAEKRTEDNVGEREHAKQALNTVTGNSYDTAILWDAETGRLIHQFEKHSTGNAVSNGGAAFSPDGKTIATGMGNKRVFLRRATSGKQLVTLDGHRGLIGVKGIAFSSNGRQLLSHSMNEAILWDVATGKRLHQFRVVQDRIRSVAFVPAGPVAITSPVGAMPGSVQIRHVLSKRNILPSACERHGYLTSSAINPNGRQIAVAVMDNNATLILNTRTGLPRILQGGPGLCVRGPADYMQWLALGSALTSLAEAVPDSKVHLLPVSCIAFSPDGRQILTGSQDTTAILWDAETGQRIHKLQGHRGLASSGKVSFKQRWRGLKLLFTGEYDPESAEEKAERVRQYEDTKPGVIVDAMFSPDNKHAVTIGNDDKAVVWECATGRKVRELLLGTKGHDTKLEFSPDGKLAMTGSLSKDSVTLWDFPTGKKLPTAAEDIAALHGFFFSPDGRPLLLARFKDKLSDSRIYMSDVRTREVVRYFDSVPWQDYTKVAWGPKRKCVAFPDWRTNEVVIQEFESGLEVRRFEGHNGTVESIAFGPDGYRLLSQSRDGTCRLWDVATGQELIRINLLANQGDWLATTPEGLFDGSAGGREAIMFRVGGGLNVVPVDRFFQDCYYPGLLAAVWRGERPLPKVEMGRSLPPKVRIITPEKGGVVETDRVTVEVEVTDEGGGVRGPWLVQNEARVLAPEKTVRQGKNILRTFKIALVNGENKLRFHAASADGSWESEPALLTLRYEKPLHKPELYLVSIGVNRYEEESMNLDLATGDAKAMAGLFQQRGPALYQKVHATVLLNEQATAIGILDTLRQISEEARPQDSVAVFLAGHGTIVGRQYYFLPHEFHRRADSLEEDVLTQGLCAARIQDALVTIPALKRIVVFDTGQSGGTVNLAHTSRDPFAFRGAIERLSRASGAFMIASAAISDKAREVHELKHGLLSYTLLAGLRAAETGPLADQWIQPKGPDRVADVLDWFGFASSHMPRLTKNYFGQQQAVQHSSLGASFPVLPVPGSDKPPRIAPATEYRASKTQHKAAVVTGSGKTDIYVVAVGINKYREEAMNLKFARNDAESIAKLFGNRGELQYRKVLTTEVLDAQATKQGILNALEKTSVQAKPEDTLVVFLSGHGRMVGQRYYLIPHDFHRQKESVEEDIRRQGLPSDALADVMSKVPAQKRILIFDTCASGGALKISRQGEGLFGFRGAIEKLSRRQGVFTIAASAAGQEAQEIDQLGHGVLTYALLAGLRAVPPGGPLEGLAVGPNGPEGNVDILDWFSFASGHVPRLTRRFLGQVQEVQTSAQGTSFAILSAWEK